MKLRLHPLAFVFIARRERERERRGMEVWGEMEGGRQGGKGK